MREPTANAPSLEQIKERLSKAGLPIPPIPGHFVDKLRSFGQSCFATRRIHPFRMYDFHQYLIEALTGKATDYLAFGHAGHGVNSYAFTYQLIDGPLVLMAQGPFGGVYMGQAEADRLDRLLERCAVLIENMQRRRREHDSSRRLLVFESELRDVNAWGWLDGALESPQEAQRWIATHRVEVDRCQPDFEQQLPTSAAVRAR
jgi:hypothetical protein